MHTIHHRQKFSLAFNTQCKYYKSVIWKPARVITTLDITQIHAAIILQLVFRLRQFPVHLYASFMQCIFSISEGARTFWNQCYRRLCADIVQSAREIRPDDCLFRFFDAFCCTRRSFPSCRCRLHWFSCFLHRNRMLSLRSDQVHDPSVFHVIFIIAPVRLKLQFEQFPKLAYRAYLNCKNLLFAIHRVSLPDSCCHGAVKHVPVPFTLVELSNPGFFQVPINKTFFSIDMYGCVQMPLKIIGINGGRINKSLLY